MKFFILFLYLSVFAPETVFAKENVSCTKEASLKIAEDLQDTVANLTLYPTVHQIHATWALANPSGDVTGYKVTFKQDNASLEDSNCVVNASTTSTALAVDCTYMFINNPLLQCTHYWVAVTPQKSSNNVGQPMTEATYTRFDTAKGLEIQCEFDEDLRMTVHWNYIGDCTSKNLSWTEDILWRSDPESYIEGEKYFGYDEGNSGPSVTDFIPYTEYQFLVQLSAIEFSEQHNCTSPQEAPSQPQNVTVEVSGANTALVSWLAPTEANGILTEYHIKTETILNGNPYTNDKYVNYTQLKQNYTLTNLPNDQTISVSLRAKTEVDNYGPYSATVNFSIPSENIDAWVVTLIVVGILIAVLLIIYGVHLIKSRREAHATEKNTTEL